MRLMTSIRSWEYYTNCKHPSYHYEPYDLTPESPRLHATAVVKYMVGGAGLPTPTPARMTTDAREPLREQCRLKKSKSRRFNQHGTTAAGNAGPSIIAVFVVPSYANDGQQHLKIQILKIKTTTGPHQGGGESRSPKSMELGLRSQP